MSTAHLNTPEARAKRAATRQANIAQTRNTIKPGSEATDLMPGDPVRIARSGVSWRYKARTGWVAVVNTERYDNGCPDYTEVGVTFAIAKDWTRASADAWFRVDELEPR
jgi:hypothetical protein